MRLLLLVLAVGIGMTTPTYGGPRHGFAPGNFGVPGKKADYCSVYGDPHFRSFDGSHYDIHEEGSFVLVRPCDTNEFEVSANFYRPHAGAIFTLIDTVTVEVGGDVAVIDRGPPLSASYNGNPVTFPSTHGPFEFSEVDGTIYILIPDHGIQISFDGNLARIWVTMSWMNKLCGACGNYSGDPSDDKDEIQNHITTDTECSPWGTRATRKECRKHLVKMYRNCRSRVPMRGFFGNCAFDECAEKGASRFTLDALKEICSGEGDRMFAQKMVAAQVQEK